jgi:hypothetical protein
MTRFRHEIPHLGQFYAILVSKTEIECSCVEHFHGVAWIMFKKTRGFLDNLLNRCLALFILTSLHSQGLEAVVSQFIL